MLTNREIIEFIRADKTSNKKQNAKVGDNYYKGKHDIQKYKLYYYNEHGEIVEDTTRSNIKISHPFFTELVDQQVQYMLSGKNSIVRSDDQVLQEHLNNYFNDDFKSELYELLEDTVVKGFGYLYMYIDKEGKIKFQSANPMGVVECDARDTSDDKEYIIYYYRDFIDKGKKEITRVQIWDDKSVSYYISEGEKLYLDTDRSINPRPHILYEGSQDEQYRYYDEFGMIPFFRLDNNNEQLSNIHTIKALIDDYDLMSCGLSNNLQDASEYLVVVKGFEGDNLEKLMKNIKTKKHIGVQGGGDVDYRTVSVPYEARQTKLALDEVNIYRFGMGFNSALVGDGNITNVVIKSRYALLDLKCNKLELRLRKLIRKLLEVIIADINEKNKTEYSVDDAYIVFDREIITNAMDNVQIEQTKAQTQGIELNNLLNLTATLGDYTVLQGICDILELDYTEVKKNIPKEELPYE